jgi:hypothetical protein
MTTYHMDENENIIKSPATRDEICAWANQYHKLYFSHVQEPSITIDLVTNDGETGCFIPELGHIRIHRSMAAFEKSCRIVLLHEMVHIVLNQENGDPDPNHGARFRREIDRLIKSGAYSGLL